jgi:hypothetical protein
MIDWSTMDYTQTHTGNVYVSDDNDMRGIGIYNGDSRTQRINRNDKKIDRWESGQKIISNHENIENIYNVAWDEQPPHYNPSSGRCSHLVPDNRIRTSAVDKLCSHRCNEIKHKGCCEDKIKCCRKKDKCCNKKSNNSSLQTFVIIIFFVLVFILSMNIGISNHIQYIVGSYRRAISSNG